MFTSLQNIVILSVIVIVLAGVKSTNVVCPHNGTYDLCDLCAIFSKTGFVDIIPLCCKPLTYAYAGLQDFVLTRYGTRQQLYRRLMLIVTVCCKKYKTKHVTATIFRPRIQP